MKIYNYHPVTKEFLCESIADKDPLVEGNYLIPAYATDIEPPKSEVGHTTVYTVDDQKWENIIDNRGITYWVDYFTAYTIKELGEEIPENSSLERPEQEEDTSNTEHLWVKSELDKVDVELMYHWTGDTTRQSYTEQVWKDYAIELRNYTTLVDNIPVVNSDVRPTNPYNVEE